MSSYDMDVKFVEKHYLNIVTWWPRHNLSLINMLTWNLLQKEAPKAP